MNNIFDTHSHYTDDAYNNDRDSLLTEIFDKVVSYIIECATDYDSSVKALKLSEKFDNLYVALGIHGLDAEHAYKTDFEKIKPLFENKKVVAVGEIGLDYHYEKESRNIQIECFKSHLSLANELNLPVIVHDREAHQDTFDLIKEYNSRGIIHCYSGSVEMAKEYIKLGLYIGIGGAVTFKNAKTIKEVAKIIPIENIVLETDCPYMTPEPYRGKRNRSDYIKFVAQKIADIKNMEAQEVINICTENTKSLFNIK